MGAAQVSLHVLVVDDYPDVADLLAALITEGSPMAITTDVGYDGQQALALAIGGRPNVAVLDIDMPIMNGIEAALAIRSALANKAPRMIALTGYPGHASSAQARVAFDLILTKPVDIDNLIDRLADG
jgi:CheY-like chemotaxis protein